MRAAEIGADHRRGLVLGDDGGPLDAGALLHVEAPIDRRIDTILPSIGIIDLALALRGFGAAAALHLPARFTGAARDDTVTDQVTASTSILRNGEAIDLLRRAARIRRAASARRTCVELAAPARGRGFHGPARHSGNRRCGDS